MKRLEVRLNLEVVAPLLDAIKSVADALQDKLAAPLELGEVDEDLRDFWRDELIAGQNGDIDRLLGLFGDEFFATGLVVFDENNAESIIRACAAVRLKLREQHLHGINDGLLESGDIEMDQLPAAVQKIFMCYLFLATLQELIIQNMGEPVAEE